MDKQTLSNYGWIVVCILVISVMLALATPFGEFIAGGFKSAYVGFSHTADAALGVIGLGGNGGSGDEGGSNEGQTPIDPITDLEMYVTTLDDGQGDIYFMANRPIADDEKIPVYWSDGLTLSNDIIATGSNTGYIDPAAFEEMDLGDDMPYYVAIVSHDKWIYDYNGMTWDGSSPIALIEQVDFSYGLGGGVTLGNISLDDGTNKTKFMVIYDGLTPNDAMLSNPAVSYEDGIATFILEPNSFINVAPAEGTDGVYLNPYAIPIEGNPDVINNGSVEATYFVEKGNDYVTWVFIISTDPNAGGSSGAGSAINMHEMAINGSTLNIWYSVDEGLFSDYFEIYVDSELFTTTTERTIDLSSFANGEPREIAVSVVGYVDGLDDSVGDMLFWQYIPAFEFEIVGTDVNILNAHPDVTYALIINGEEVGDFDNGTISLLYRGLENGVDYEVSVVARYSYFDGLYSGAVTYTHNETTACTHENVHAQDMGWALVGNHELYCDECGEYVDVEAHYDNDQDGLCDGCGSNDVN